ncbi:hypothetical protein FOCC_FOCC007761 [Frankliniella occidentalis]|nr:hypothetical protein FOCC_FOCC007761 [Frankliniella occidentalis]
MNRKFTANETRTAFNQIGDILGSQFSDSQSRTTTARTTTTSTTTSSSLSSDAARLESEPEPLQAGVPHGRGPIPAGGHDGGLQHHRGVEAAAVSALRARPRASSSHLHVRGPHLGRAEELQREQLGAVRRRIRQRGRRRQRRRRPHASLHRENCCFAALIESSSHFRVDSGKMYYADRSPAWPEQFARFCSAVGFYRDLSAAQSIFMIKTPCYAVETSVPFSAACYTGKTNVTEVTFLDATKPGNVW